MNVKVYEREEDLGVLILGLNQDPSRKAFNEIVTVIEQEGITVQREITHDQNKVLPIIELNGEVVVEGRYPTPEEVSTWLDMPVEKFAHIKTESSLFQAANDGRISACCGVGTDVYLDPNEE